MGFGRRCAFDSDILNYYSQLGNGGIGYVWSICEGSVEEEWRHSVAPIPSNKLEKALQAADDELELTQDSNVLPTSGELKSDSNFSDGDDNEDSRDDSIHFEKEVSSYCISDVWWQGHSSCLTSTIFLFAGRSNVSEGCA